MGTEQTTTEKKITTVSLPMDLYEKIAAEAAREHRTFSGQLSYFLESSVLRHTTQA
jgi:hypothetical protein